MTKEELGRLITAPQQANNNHLLELLNLSQQYPYCAPLQSLILVLLHRINDLRFASELHERALILPDLRRLFFLLNSSTGTTINPRNTEIERGSNTFSLIDSFLEEHPEDSSELELLFAPAQSTIIKEDTDADEIIAQFLEQGEKAETIEPLIPKEKLEAKQNEASNVGTNDEDELLTETLARMYIRQGKYERAERILRQIYLEFPKKSGYFAEQLNFLEKLIKNNEVGR
ncbi:MAG: hypothetical protein PUK66_02395 [Bacteroidales bacterium]|uniref:hypothetical protein n=1 Tax=Porphyromonas sp. TaxID=1924944 RepID=UPI002970BE57|nr:hypothetical protein [Porphyromonas sp.]MDD7437680.1 hypothetical protein [Bacteroidales bacterium]MDY3067627.1 hypothetical protein [Porphyromonas sp.]